MKNVHLTDRQLQQYLFDHVADTHSAEHINNCEVCALRLNNYRLIFDEVSVQNVANFNFSVNEYIAAAIPQYKERTRADYFVPLVMLAGAIIFVAISYLTILFVAPSISWITILLILTAAVFIAYFNFSQLFADHQKKMKMLNTINAT